MALILVLCSLLFCFASLMTWIEAKYERKRKLIAGNQGENKVVNALLELGYQDMACDFLATGRNGKQAQIDLAIKVGHLVIVVETKNWSGTIYGGSKDIEWKVFKRNGVMIIHRNPLFQAARQARILQEATGHPAVGLVMMAGRGQHNTKTFPLNIATWDTLDEEIKKLVKLKSPLQKPSDEAWSKVIKIASDPNSKEATIAYGSFLNSVIGNKPWLSWLALGAITAASAIFIEEHTVYVFEMLLVYMGF